MFLKILFSHIILIYNYKKYFVLWVFWQKYNKNVLGSNLILGAMIVAYFYDMLWFNTELAFT